jgi:methylated-DNA-protein-cysteine methyltransferase-like protein
MPFTILLQDGENRAAKADTAEIILIYRLCSLAASTALDTVGISNSFSMRSTDSSRRQMRQVSNRIAKSGLKSDELRDSAFRRVILSIPKGKVATYGQVAAAAGYPLYHRAVARLLRVEATDRLPWQRVVGAGGEIKLRFEAAAEQRLRLRMEGVTFKGKKVNLELHQHPFRTWEI